MTAKLRCNTFGVNKSLRGVDLFICVARVNTCVVKGEGYDAVSQFKQNKFLHLKILILNKSTSPKKTLV